MSDYYNPLIKFSYTILDPDGIPQQKSWIVNLSYVISIESTGANDLKIYLNNDQVISVDLGYDLNAEDVMDEILSMSAVGNDYSVYRIDTFQK